jgi:transposase-like protein
MTDTIEPVMLDEDEKQALAQRLVEQARAEGVDLIGPGGLLSGLTKQVLEAALEGEIAEHLGYDKHDPTGRNGGNSRNGTRSKTVMTEVGPVELDVPRDRDGTFDPKIVRKRQRRLDGVDQIVLSLTARGLTTGRWRRTSPTSTTPTSARTRSAASPTRSSARWPSGRPGRWTASTR